MKLELRNNIVDVLEKELACYKDSILEVLNGYTDFEKLDISELSKMGFLHEGTKKGTAFIDGLRSFFHKKDIDFETSLWIITKWGGIGSFKDNQANKDRIIKLGSGLEKRKFTKDLFGVISSLSKIASFLNHDEYFVYDSRVIYSLNWLILKGNIKEPLFFPMPESRSSKLTLFDLDTIIHLFYKDDIEKPGFKKSLFVNTNDAYFVYCDLIKELNNRLFPDHKPYYLEMLLFVIADTTIFDELKSSVQIKIN